MEEDPDVARSGRGFRCSYLLEEDPNVAGWILKGIDLNTVAGWILEGMDVAGNI